MYCIYLLSITCHDGLYEYLFFRLQLWKKIYILASILQIPSHQLSGTYIPIAVSNSTHYIVIIHRLDNYILLAPFHFRYFHTKLQLFHIDTLDISRKTSILSCHTTEIATITISDTVVGLRKSIRGMALEATIVVIPVCLHLAALHRIPMIRDTMLIVEEVILEMKEATEIVTTMADTVQTTAKDRMEEDDTTTSTTST